MVKVAKKLTNLTVGGLMLISAACAPVQTNFKGINNTVVSKQATKSVGNDVMKPELANFIMAQMKETYDANVNSATAGFIGNDTWNPVLEKKANVPPATDDGNNLAFYKTFNVESKKGSLPVKEVSVLAGVDATGLNVGFTPVIKTQLPLNNQNAACKFLKAAFPADVAIGTVYNYETGKVANNFHPSWDLTPLHGNDIAEYLIPGRVKISVDDFGVMTRIEGAWNKSTEGKNLAGKIAKAVLPSDIAADSVLVGKKIEYQYTYGWDLSVLPQNFITEHILPKNLRVATNTLGQIIHYEGVWDNSPKENDSVLKKVLKFISPDRITLDRETFGKSHKNIGIFKDIKVEF